MRLLDDWNWYLPSWLEWLPRIRTEGDMTERIEPEDLGDAGEPDAEPEPEPAPVPA